MKNKTKEQFEYCEKCRRTQRIHGTLCKKHKKEDLSPDRANDGLIEYKFDDEDTCPLII